MTESLVESEKQDYRAHHFAQIADKDESSLSTVYMDLIIASRIGASCIATHCRDPRQDWLGRLHSPILYLYHNPLGVSSFAGGLLAGAHNLGGI